MGRRALKALVGLEIVLRVASLAELLVRVLVRLPGKRLPKIIVGHQLIQGVRQPIDRRRGGQASRLPIEHHRSEERRVGNECVITCSSLWSPLDEKKNM